MDVRRGMARREKSRRGTFRRLQIRLMKFRPLPWRGRSERTQRRHRGAGALLGVLLLASLAGAALAAHYEARDAGRTLALDRAAGRVFAGWVHAAHRAAQGHADAFEAALDTQLGILLTVARLRTLGAAPPDLRERPGREASMVLGVIADGTAPGAPGRSPVPMAFGVLEPSPSSRPTALREGALEGGLAALAPGGGPLMEAHRPAIEAAMGRAMAEDALWVTADFGLRYRERALYRRAQPGRPWLNRMETALRMAPPGATHPADPARRHVLDGGEVGAAAAEVGTDIAVGGMADIGGEAEAHGVTADTVEAGELAAPQFAVSAELVVGAALTGGLVADRVNATGQLEAGALRTAGALDAAALSVAGAASVQGAAAARGVAGETLSVAGTLSGSSTAVGGVYGPAATVSGLLTVGSCAGCEGE